MTARPEKVACVGSRHGAHLEAAEHYVAMLPAGTLVISGAADGVDATCAMAARVRGMAVVELKPDYFKHGKRAPLERNKEIAAACDRLVAFWNGKSTGTMHAVREARKLGKPVLVIGPDGGGWDPNAVDYDSPSNKRLRAEVATLKGAPDA